MLSRSTLIVNQILQEEFMHEPKTSSNSNTNETSAKEQPAPRPWLKPTFERTNLKEAMASMAGTGTDLTFYS